MIWRRFVDAIRAWRMRHQSFGELHRLVDLEMRTMSLDDANPLTRAKVSLQAGDHDAARRFLNVARERIPSYVESSHDTLDIMLGLGDFDDLDAFALARAKRSRNDPRYLEAYAQSADRRRDFEEAARRWAMARKRFPGRKLGYTGGMVALRQIGRFDGAEALLRQATRLFSDDLTVAIEASRLAEARADWATAYQRWETVRSRHPAGYIGAAEALHRLGRTDEADALLAEGRVRWPIEPGIAILQARMAEEIGDIPKALERWAIVRQRFPFERSGYLDGLRLLREQRAWEEADAVALAAIDRFHKEPERRADYAALAEARQDWLAAVERWDAMCTAFPDRADAQRRRAEAQANAARSDRSSPSPNDRASPSPD